MATKPISKFTVQESNNLKVYENYHSELLTLATTYVEIDPAGDASNDNWVENGDGPAKSITIIPYVIDATDVITLTLDINGTYGDEMVLEAQDFPLTIDKLLVNGLKMKSNEGVDEKFTILSFH
jgi:hypothetical protein|tara:strand:+ start:466 stop:837 length:372 start_codon:yes stop_codon:yes gene_type:complete